MANVLNVTLHDYDICTAHRLQARGNNIPTIVVRLNNRNKKSEMIVSSKRNKLHGKDLNLNPAVPIYVSEHLTLRGMATLKKANDLKRKGKIASAWVIDGKIYIRKIDEGPAIRIKDESKLELVEEEARNDSKEAEGDPQKSTAQKPVLI